MPSDSDLHGPHALIPQQRAIGISEQLPATGSKVSTAVQFETHPLPTHAENEQGKSSHVVATSAKYTLPTLTSSMKTFELGYQEPFKIRLPHVVTSEPSSISATLHISVEPLSGCSKDDAPQVRIVDRGIVCPPGLMIPFRKYWDADSRRYMIGVPSPFGDDVQDFPEGAESMNQSASRVPLGYWCSCCSRCCREGNLNKDFLWSSYGRLNALLIAGCCVLTFYGLPVTGSAYTHRMVAITAWSQMSSHLLLFFYKSFSAAEVLELPRLYEHIHMAGTFLLMIVSAVMFFGAHGLPSNSWHMSILCLGIALLALALLVRVSVKPLEVGLSAE